MRSKQVLREAFVKSLPIMCSYLFVAFGYGLMMEKAGFAWYYSLLASLLVYTGAFQFVLITFLSSGTSLVTAAATALLMNSRQIFYSLTFLKEFKAMGRRKLYMIHSMTDETYAVNCTIPRDDPNRGALMFWVALFSQCYWMIGSVAGGLLGQILPLSPDGIDFCMTALFVIIFIDQWEKAKSHMPALLGLAVGCICLLVFGPNAFILPALILTSGILVSVQGREAGHASH